jgi:hypothetical protein
VVDEFRGIPVPRHLKTQVKLNPAGSEAEGPLQVVVGVTLELGASEANALAIMGLKPSADKINQIILNSATQMHGIYTRIRLCMYANLFFPRAFRELDKYDQCAFFERVYAIENGFTLISQTCLLNSR